MTEIFIDIFYKYAIFRVTRPCTPLNNASHAGLFFCPNDFQEGKLIFSKPPRTPEYLARKLIQNGLQGITELELTEIFQSINYYKLRGYTYPYQDNSVPGSPFLQSIKWSSIWNDYIFDLKLRALLFSQITHIETALKTRMTLVSLTQGILWYQDNRLFRCQNAFNSDLALLQNDWQRASEQFKNHYISTYPESPNPPAWMIFETSSFGPISKFFKNMKPQLPEKESICNYFGFEKIQADKLASWFQNINIVRNICAHHGRLFSRHLTTAPYFMTPQKGSWVSNWPNPCRIYASICIIQSLLNICYKENTFATELKELMKMVRKEQLPTMGFPQNWQNEDLFNLK